MKKIYIFTGHYGSGKTEVAINFALLKAKEGGSVVIVDLDIVNPYFRTKDAEAELQNHGIRVITPEFANTNIDLPTLPGEINSVFDGVEETVIFDVGGDDDGAIALGRYSKQISSLPYQMYVVANLKRPLTQTKEDLVDMVRNIEFSSRLKATDIICNTNISYETTPQTLLYKLDVLGEACIELGVNLAFLSGKREVLAGLPAELISKSFELKLYLNPDWLR